MNSKLQLYRLGKVCVGFAFGFYFTLNMDQLYFYSLHSKFYVPLQKELENPNHTAISVIQTAKKGLIESYEDL